MPIYKNKHNLPLPVYMALCRDDYEHYGDYGCTELLDAPRPKILFARHQDKIEIEVMDRVWSLHGSAKHYVMQQVQMKGAMQEQRFMVQVLGKQISMQPDYIYPVRDSKDKVQEFHLLDFKDTSVHTLTNERKIEEWRKQVNIYRWGTRQKGFNVTKIFIVVFLRDWSYTDAKIKKVWNYPQNQIHIIEVTPMDEGKVQLMLEDRIRIHEAAKEVADDLLPECSDQERWAVPDRFAVKLKGSDRALPKASSFSTRGEAEKFMADRIAKNVPKPVKEGKKPKKEKEQEELEIEYRKGENRRCDRYCPVASLCNQYKKLAGIGSVNQKKEDPF